MSIDEIVEAIPLLDEADLVPIKHAIAMLEKKLRNERRRATSTARWERIRQLEKAAKEAEELAAAQANRRPVNQMLKENDAKNKKALAAGGKHEA